MLLFLVVVCFLAIFFVTVVIIRSLEDDEDEGESNYVVDGDDPGFLCRWWVAGSLTPVTHHSGMFVGRRPVLRPRLRLPMITRHLPDGSMEPLFAIPQTKPKPVYDSLKDELRKQNEQARRDFENFEGR